ncbi:N-acetyl-anhydromuramyl-L-alanine amidase AmpD [Undibacterium sp. GrIS 1.2]|uniref:peptidoglycan recognition protein family protein n=1 Tax=Undibacterium sp. GrIS 1.2 TaxID=3143933 RepID=UPI0033933E24
MHLLIDLDGMVVDRRVTKARSKSIERGKLKTINGIIVHQTGGATAQSSIDSYKNPSANGAHFLIDIDGRIYQTASIYQQTWHVGKLKSRCIWEKRCTPIELKQLQHFSPSGENKREMAKDFPNRFPSNQDSIGIEIVGEATSPAGGKVNEQNQVYRTVNKDQNTSLQWLVSELSALLEIQTSEIFRHPDVSRKNPTEASTAKW